ncbi:MAG TPA: efflux RND transporter periplasmic adaptor subunit [Thermodesulfobacteriota bacterium]|nr:efflux RND transporter periplasmic adaptor subunit [Thermodesulfobacteriota bacterium]
MKPTSEDKWMNGEKRLTRILVRIALPVIVLIVGVGVAIGLIETSPKIQKQSPVRQARLVEVQRVYLSNQQTAVHAMGTVLPSREVVLHPQVTGNVIAVSEEFIPGGRFKQGDVLVKIDPADYELAVRQRESDVAKAQSDLALEMGQQSIAEREYELLGEVIKEEDKDLVLRKPQLEKARSTLNAAKAALEQAKLNLERTAVKAPFDLMILTRDVNVGTQVTTSTTLATVVGTHEYWIEATVPVDELKWIAIPESGSETGSTVRVFNEAAWGREKFRTGSVIRLLGNLEEESRMARLLIKVEDPLALLPENKDKPALILDNFVRVEIEGIELESVVAVDREFVHNGNQVWIMNDQNKLEIRTVDVVFSGQDKFYVKNGLKNGERLVTTLLSSPVEGMELRTDNDSSNPLSKSSDFSTEVKGN